MKISQKIKFRQTLKIVMIIYGHLVLQFKIYSAILFSCDDSSKPEIFATKKISL